MAHGSPDWHKLSDVDILAQSVGDIHINVAAQDIAQIINRPTYGGANVSTYDSNPPTSTTTELISITGQGVIYGGYIWIHDGTSRYNDSFILHVDGVDIFNITSYYLRTLNFSKYENTPLRMCVYNEYMKYYLATIQNDITFESNFKIKYANAGGGASTVTAQAYYATL